MFAKSAQDCTVISCHLDAMHSCGRREQCARNAGALHKFSAAYGPDPRFSPPPRKRKTRSGYPRLTQGRVKVELKTQLNKPTKRADHEHSTLPRASTSANQVDSGSVTSTRARQMSSNCYRNYRRVGLISTEHVSRQQDIIHN